ncbi:S26 family signal peptidase [Nonomuraea sp. NPDC001636]|uniref:S26 family signal peptidase n=1 Tax=Nonomuraea sp. NPDC001636 TaxID=3154391 RepID=UPI003331958E
MRCLAGFVTVVAVAALVWARRRFLSVRVEGVSMEPTLRPGQRLLARRAEGTTGDIVIVRNPHATAPNPPLLVKRLVAGGGERLPDVLGGGLVPAGRIAVLGDNPRRSVDSRHFGLLHASDVVAVVRSRRRGSGGTPG